MTTKRTTITLELVLDGEGLSGRAVGADDAAHEFSGRLGLMHAIDGLLATADGSPNEDAIATGEGDHREEHQS